MMELLRLAAAEGLLAEATAFLRRGGEAAGLPEERLGELDLVVEELFVNVARYSGAAAVELRYAPGAGVLEAEIADNGRAFDPLTRAEPDLDIPLEKRQVGGLGIFLVRRMTRAMSYERDAEWNRIRFTIGV